MIDLTTDKTDHLPKRKPTRLQGFDYTKSGSYFVTVCSRQRKNLFGKIENGKMILNQNGQILNDICLDLINHNSNIELNIYCIMPNHVHAIITIVGNGSKPFRSNAENKHKNNPHGIPEIIRQLKTFSSRKINEVNKRNGLEPFPTGGIWQKSYYDRIIRNEPEYQKIWSYIENNPVTWDKDRFHNQV